MELCDKQLYCVGVGADSSDDVPGNNADSIDVPCDSDGSIDVPCDSDGSIDVFGDNTGSIDVLGDNAGSIDVLGDNAGAIHLDWGVVDHIDFVEWGGVNSIDNRRGINLKREYAIAQNRREFLNHHL